LKLSNSIDTGHSANIFCTKFLPETGDDVVVSGAADAEVRVHRVTRSTVSSARASFSEQCAVFRCHTRRVKKLAVEAGNPHVIWSASEDGTLRQHDLRDCVSCPANGATDDDCRNILLDLRNGAKKSLQASPRHSLHLKTCAISPTQPHLLLIGGSDAFARLYDRRMLSPPTASRQQPKAPPCVCYFCPAHLSDHVHFLYCEITARDFS
jgi:WD and tetratricopeptide repeat-containing protein 1